MCTNCDSAWESIRDHNGSCDMCSRGLNCFKIGDLWDAHKMAEDHCGTDTEQGA